MLQTWILPRDVAPHVAIRTGADVSVCGTCPHRPALYRSTGMARCYVNTFQAPLGVWKAFHRGRYPTVPPAIVGADRSVRIGSWGDPGAATTHVWRDLTAHATGHTGYTHRWRQRPDLAPYCMASVDSSMEHAIAEESGWRTFRVRPASVPYNSPREVTCPATTAHNVTCAACMLCSGATRTAKSVAIAAH